MHHTSSPIHAHGNSAWPPHQPRPCLLPYIPSYQTAAAVRLQALAAYNILSAPISDASSGEYVGMLDVGDVMAAVVRGGRLAIARVLWLQSGKTTATSRQQWLSIRFGEWYGVRSSPSYPSTANSQRLPACCVKVCIQSCLKQASWSGTSGCPYQSCSRVGGRPGSWGGGRAARRQFGCASSGVKPVHVPSKWCMTCSCRVVLVPCKQPLPVPAGFCHRSAAGVEFCAHKLGSLLHGGDLWFKGGHAPTGWLISRPPKQLPASC